MADFEKDISNALGIASQVTKDLTKTATSIQQEIERVEVAEVSNQEAKERLREDEIDEDYRLARSNLHDLLTKGQDALDRLMTVANETEHPRVFEVMSQLMRTIVDTNKDLMEIQKRTKELKEKSKNSPTNVTNALFVGSTSDLQKMLKDAKNEPSEDES